MAMDTGTRAFDGSSSNLTGRYTYERFDHSLSAPAIYVLVMLLAKRLRSLFAQLAFYTFRRANSGRPHR